MISLDFQIARHYELLDQIHRCFREFPRRHSSLEEDVDLCGRATLGLWYHEESEHERDQAATSPEESCLSTPAPCCCVQLIRREDARCQ